MQIAAVLFIFALVFGLILFLKIRLVWRRYRLIAISLPVGSDFEAFSFKLTEAIRSLRYREGSQSGPVRVFQAPAWQRWAVGLQDICVEPVGSGMVLLTGPAFNVSLIGKSYQGATMRPYTGPQSVWPLVKGMMRLMGAGVGVLAAIGLSLFLFAPMN
jgi:hypothetical protein